MPLPWARFAAFALETYALLGVIFAIVFVTTGVARLDARARGAGWGFRFLLLPGAALWWPWLALKWARLGR